MEDEVQNIKVMFVLSLNFKVVYVGDFEILVNSNAFLFWDFEFKY